MRRKETQTLDQLLSKYLNITGLQSPLNEYRLVHSWDKVVEKPIADRTEQVYLRNQTLHVHLSSPALRSQLSMRRSELVQKLNQVVEAQVIYDIVFH